MQTINMLYFVEYNETCNENEKDMMMMVIRIIIMIQLINMVTMKKRIMMVMIAQW